MRAYLKIRAMQVQPRNIPTTFSRILLDLLSESGFHPSSVLRGTGIELSSIADPEFKLDLNQQLGLYEKAIEVSGIPGLGLLQGRRMSPGHLGILGYAIQTSSDLRQALGLLVTYSSISGALMDFSLHSEGDTQILTAVNIRAEKDLRRYLLEEHFATVDRILKTITHERFRPSSVSFDYPAPDWRPLYREVFGCAVEFDAGLTAYRFGVNMLDLGVDFADPETARACERRCEDLISQLSQAGTCTDQVRRVILMLPCGSRNLPAVAQKMSTSARNLRRKLAAEGMNFQRLLNEVRLELAVQYLRGTNLPLEDIAALLGYSEGANFRHAFKKWTGLTPNALRLER